MKTRYVILAVAAAFGLGLTGGQVFSQDMGEGGPTPEQIEMQKLWMKASTPGEQHRKYAEMVGEWSADVTTWMGGQAGKTKGKCTNRMVLGGRYMVEEYTGMMDVGGGMQIPFSGQLIAGYDNLKEEFQSVWIDTAGTGMVIMTGKPGEDPNVSSMESEFEENAFMGGARMKHKGVTTTVDKDKWIYDMYMVDEAGKETKFMNIVYTRRQKKAEEGAK